MKALDPVLKMLFLGILFFTGVLFVSERFFPMDGQIFQDVAGLVTKNLFVGMCFRQHGDAVFDPCQSGGAIG